MRSFFHSRWRLVIAAIVIAIAAAAAVYGYSAGDNNPEQQKSRSDFIATCKLQGRAANGGAQLPMDDATEERLDLYCSCIADCLDQVLTPIEIGSIGGGTASPEVLKKLNGIVNACQSQHLTPAPADETTSPTTPAN
jgi:type II secretory pathway pseudopilin PulG